MKTLAFGLILTGVALLVAGCRSSDPAVGKYRMTGGEAVFGPGADQTILELKANKTFTLDLDPIHLADGTYTIEDNTLKLNQAGAYPLAYRIAGPSLIPLRPEGGEVATWSFRKQ